MLKMHILRFKLIFKQLNDYFSTSYRVIQSTALIKKKMGLLESMWSKGRVHETKEIELSIEIAVCKIKCIVNILVN